MLNKLSSNEKLHKIEKRIEEIIEESPRRKHNLSEDYDDSIESFVESESIKHLDVEREKLEYRRRIILDSRNSPQSRFLWKVIAPIIVFSATTFLILVLQ